MSDHDLGDDDAARPAWLQIEEPIGLKRCCRAIGERDSLSSYDNPITLHAPHAVVGRGLVVPDEHGHFDTTPQMPAKQVSPHSTSPFWVGQTDPGAGHSLHQNSFTSSPHPHDQRAELSAAGAPLASYEQRSPASQDTSPRRMSSQPAQFAAASWPTSTDTAQACDSHAAQSSSKTTARPRIAALTVAPSIRVRASGWLALRSGALPAWSTVPVRGRGS